MRRLGALGLAGALALVAGCTDDGGTVRSGGPAAIGNAATTEAGSGLSGADLGTQSADKGVIAAVSAYRSYVLAELATLRARTSQFTAAVRADDVAAAKQRYAPSRLSWERIEPIAGLVPDLDGMLDSRVDDFAGPDDPKWTGWHRLEYLLWAKDTAAGGTPLANRLDRDLRTLQAEVATITLTPKAVAIGAKDLIEEVSNGKLTGEEDRYSHTDLWDFAGNVQGAKAAYTAFRTVLVAKKPALATELDGRFAAIETSLAAYKVGDGYRTYQALTAADRTRMRAELAALSEGLALLPTALGI